MQDTEIICMIQQELEEKCSPADFPNKPEGLASRADHEIITPCFMLPIDAHSLHDVTMRCDAGSINLAISERRQPRCHKERLEAPL